MMHRTLQGLLALAVATGVMSSLAACSSSGSTEIEPEEFEVSFEPTGLNLAAITEPFTVEATVTRDGKQASGYLWRWSIESFGHDEAPESEPGLERNVITPLAESEFVVWGQLGMEDDEGKVSWVSHEGPTLLPWGGEPAGIGRVLDSLTLAVGEERPVFAQGIARRIRVASEGEGPGHDPVQWTSDDPSVATVTEHGVVRAVAGGEATVTATYGSFSVDFEVTVDPELVIAPPSTDPTELDFPIERVGINDDRGFPMFFAQLRVPPATGIDRGGQGIGLARWTGTNVGLENVARPWDVVGRASVAGDEIITQLRMVRGYDDRLYVVYRSQIPAMTIVVASRPIDGGPGDWTHTEVAWQTSDVGNEFREGFGSPSAQIGVLPREGGGLWLGFNVESLWDPLSTMMASNGDDSGECGYAIFLAEIPGDGSAAVEAAWTIREPFIPGSPSLCPEIGEPDFEPLGGRFELIPSDTGKPTIVGLPHAPETPVQLDWSPQAARWEQSPNEAGYYSTLVDTRRPDVPPVTDLALFGWIGDDYVDVVGFDAVARFTRDDTDQWALVDTYFPADYPMFEAVEAWSVGERIYAGGRFIIDATPPEFFGRIGDDPLSPLGAAFDTEIRGRPAAFGDNEVYFMGPLNGTESWLWSDALGLRKQTGDGRLIFEDVRAVDSVLYGRTGALDDPATTLNRSLDRGRSWLAIDSIDLSRNPLDPHIDAAGNHHAFRREQATFEDRLVWTVTDPQGAVVHDVTFEERAGFFDCQLTANCHFVASTGEIVTLIEPLDPETGFSISIATTPFGGTELVPYELGISTYIVPAEEVHAIQVVERSTGELVLGFTGWDPRENGTFAILIERDLAGNWRAPHVLRPESSPGDTFWAMEPMPDGRLAVVLRSKDDIFVLRVLDELVPDPELRDMWQAMLPPRQR
jgi:hypothetical protein